MGGLKKLIPKTWAVMFVGTYAIAGFPGLSGFFSKDEILGSASASPWGNGMVLYVVGLVTALMTAFYMNRLMHKTFYTDARFVDGQLPEHHHGNFADDEDEHAANSHGHADAEEHNADSNAPAGHTHENDQVHEHGTGSVHESPPSMMFPLYVLAILSVGIGIVLGPTKIFEKFMEPSVAHMDLGPLAQGAPLVTETTGWIISGAVAILGLALAWFMYSKAKSTGELVTEQSKARNPVYLFLQDKWCFDRVYNYLFITLGGKFADRILWKIVDVRIIDGTVNGIAKLVGQLSTGVKRVQTGYVRNYALGILFGVVAVIIGLLAQWSTVHIR